MKLYVIIEEFLYAKKIENQTEVQAGSMIG